MFFIKKKEKIRLAITPRFFETEIDQLISIEKKYYNFFSKFNSEIHLIPFDNSDPEYFLNNLKPYGVIFAGGYRLYTDEIRIFEQKVLKTCLNLKLPILAICCGMWTVNGYFGGNLKFNHSHQAFDGKKIHLDKMLHPVVSNGELIKKENFIVNSFHDKVIDKLGSNLKTFLMSEDNEIEGVFNNELKILGVQFHMENKGVSKNLTKKIMDIFFNFKKNV